MKRQKRMESSRCLPCTVPVVVTEILTNKIKNLKRRTPISRNFTYFTLLQAGSADVDTVTEETLITNYQDMI